MAKVDYVARCKCVVKGRVIALRLVDQSSGEQKSFTRDEVIEMIDKHQQVIRISYIPKEGYDRNVSNVDLNAIKGQWLRADPNKTEADNLDELPVCKGDECNAVELLRQLGG